MSEQKKIVVEEALAREYARIKQVSLEVAYKDLEAKFTKEAKGVDLEQRYDALIKAFRTMSPQLNGVVMRETDMANSIKALTNKVSMLQYHVEGLEKKLEFEREVYSKSLQILNGIVEEDRKTLARIAALESNVLPFYTRIWNKIKCWLTT
jgi:predicted  nucleic acid-binding Zn-ribbon protein